MKNKQTSFQRFCVSRYQLSWIVLVYALLHFFSFSVGYFLGKRSMVISFVSSIEQNSLADHVYASLYSRYNLRNNNAMEIEPERPEIEEILKSTAQETDIKIVKNVNKKEQSIDESSVEVNLHWYAQLIGFKTRCAADRFIEKLSKSGITVQLKTRYGKSPRGKRIVWYQVITPKYNDRAQLENMLQKIKKTERINGIRIITC